MTELTEELLAQLERDAEWFSAATFRWMVTDIGLETDANSGETMPRWASRITLEVVDVRVQRLQDISVEDAMAEGIPQLAGEADAAGLFDLSKEHGYIWDNRTTVENFAMIWDSINAKGFV